MVSVVMATFNGEKYLEKQLNSILMQTLLPDEILIFDDRSVDKTEEIVNQFIKKNTTSVEIKFVKNETNLGYALNFYQGLKYARGDYIFE
ncbi:glycosyltransferase [Eubacterium limosum]|uniref:glycosyltransferase n=1 Tax=Eubacterium limosum TaxID=1736 RepID=UPI001559AE25|nr:glycosyltransferase [Eubacterium limosum]